MENKPFGPLGDKTLLCIRNRTFITTDEEMQISFWAKIKRMGLKSLCVIFQNNEENRSWCKKMKALGIVDEFNVDGLIHEKEDGRTVEEVSAGIIKWLKEKNINANAGFFFGEFPSVVGNYVCEKLGIPGDSYESSMACFLKDLTQECVLRTPESAKYGVPSYSVNTEKELLAALAKLTLPVVMKPLCGSGSVGCKVLYDTAKCLEFFSELTTGMTYGTAACEKLAQTQSVLVMEYLDGIKYGIDVTISKGKLVGGFVVERGPPPLPEFWNTSVIIPGASTKVHEELIEASYQCCLAVGLRHGIYNAEFIRIKGGGSPRLIEINPRPAGNRLFTLFEEVYTNDPLIIHAKLRCGVELSLQEMKIAPKRHLAAYYFTLVRRREKLKTAYGHMLLNAKEYGVRMLDVGPITVTKMMYDNINYVRPVLVVTMTSDESRRDAVSKLCQFLVDSKYFESMEEALLNF